MSIPVDYQKALLDPGSVFGGPEDVAADDSLSRDQKIEILRRWEYDASELSVAEEEGMPDGEASLLLRVTETLRTITGGYDVEHTPPTKQGGVGSER